MIKVSYDTFMPGATKPEHTIIKIQENRTWISYDVPGKAEATFKKMREDGKTGVLFARGMLIQTFVGKTEEEVLAIVKNDIENGLKVAKDMSGEQPEIKNLKITK